MFDSPSQTRLTIEMGLTEMYMMDLITKDLLNKYEDLIAEMYKSGAFQERFNEIQKVIQRKGMV